MENGEKKIISYKFKFGLTRFFRQDVLVAYDNINLYTHKETFPLSSITSIKRTWNENAGLKEWEINMTVNGKWRCITFYPVQSFSRNNFDEFLEFINEKFPHIKTSKNTLF